MPAGQLRERVRIERRLGNADDGFGNVRGSWVTLAGASSLAARIDPASGREDVIAAKLQGVQLVDVTVRVCTATKQIKASDRVINVRSGEIFNIRAAENRDEHRRYLTMSASRGDASG